MRIPAWMDRARCAGQLDFLDRPPADQRATCVHCTVRAECLDYGLAQDLPNANSTTVYGGLLPMELYKLALSRRRAGLLPAATA